jgi:hypothetical protein
MGIDMNENELASLEVNIVPRLVYSSCCGDPDKYSGCVCELDVVFSFYKIFTNIDELIMGGEAGKSLVVKG